MELILGVVRDREAGLELRAAIEKAKRAAQDRALAIDDASIFAGLRRGAPRTAAVPAPQAGADADQPRHRGRMRRGRPPRSAHGELPAGALLSPRAGQMARPGRGGRHGGGHGRLPRCPPSRARRPIEVPIDRTEPIGREWSLICDSPDFTALLAGWERPGQDDVDGPRADLRDGVERGARAGPRRGARVAGVIAERSRARRGARPGRAARDPGASPGRRRSCRSCGSPTAWWPTWAALRRSQHRTHPKRIDPERLGVRGPALSRASPPPSARPPPAWRRSCRR